MQQNVTYPDNGDFLLLAIVLVLLNDHYYTKKENAFNSVMQGLKVMNVCIKSLFFSLAGRQMIMICLLLEGNECVSVFRNDINNLMSNYVLGKTQINQY